MKKVFVLCLSLVLMLAMTVTAFAANGFVGSPSGNSAPTLEDFENENEDCTVDVEIVPYNERDELGEDGSKALEDAYNDILNGSDELKEIYEEIAQQGSVDAEDMAVSDVFGVKYEGCDSHDNHGTTTITLSTETLEHFAGLLVYSDGWGLVLGDKYSINGNQLTFESEGVSAYAIVVDTAGMETSPVTGDGLDTQSDFSVWAMVMAVSAVGLIAVAIASCVSRKKANG